VTPVEVLDEARVALLRLPVPIIAQHISEDFEQGWERGIADAANLLKNLSERA